MKLSTHQFKTFCVTSRMQRHERNVTGHGIAWYNVALIIWSRFKAQENWVTTKQYIYSISTFNLYAVVFKCLQCNVRKSYQTGTLYKLIPVRRWSHNGAHHHIVRIRSAKYPKFVIATEILVFDLILTL